MTPLKEHPPTYSFLSIQGWRVNFSHGHDMNQPHLGHEAVCVGVLLVLEHNVWVVVAHQFVEALRVARDLALRSSASAQVVLRQVGEKLLVVHGLELPGPGADTVAGPRPASLDQPYAAPRSQQADLCQARPPTLLHWGRFPGISGSQRYPSSRCLIACE